MPNSFSRRFTSTTCKPQPAAIRFFRLLFKMAVEMAVSENILAAVCDVNQTELTRLRGQCVQEIRKTNGLLSFDTALKWQQDG